MEKQILNTGWTLTIPEENVYNIPNKPLSVPIPGSVYSCLLDHELMPDPYYRDNELKALKLMENDFLFEEVFTPDAAVAGCDRVILRFNGIDTIADISLNGQLLDHVENMHRIFEYDVKELLKDGENHLVVKIFSPTKYIQEKHEWIETMESRDAMPGYSHLRKAHCMFGWDWGPRLPDAGLYRPVELLGVNVARLSDDVLILQDHVIAETTVLGNKVSAVNLRVKASIDADSWEGLRIESTLTDPDGKEISFDQEGKLTVENPQLWWPNGYGSQPLYTVSVKLVDDATDIVLDTVAKRIGLRTATVDVSPIVDEVRDPHIGEQIQQDKKPGRRFNFVVNGLAIFAMGADYIPEDCILSRVTPDRTRKLLEDAAAVHNNCIRVWGGGYYPEDFFYDICDELGLLVWQDFMFACASYDLNDPFEENIKQEFVDVTRRIRHHASLGLLCGNNEMETEVGWEFMSKKLPHQKQLFDYIKIYEYIIPKIVEVEAPQTFYWPSSPSSGGNYEDAMEENIGDAHYWGVWHGGDPFTAYRQHHFRFLSEFGFQSFPGLATISTFTEPEDRNVFSEIMEMHQRNTAANGKIMNYLSATYKYPKDFESLIYCSQMLQLDAIRYGVEYFRRIRGTCMGTVIWQLNDNWPVASWASIDYFGRWKALHYGEKRFFSPVAISCEEHGRIDQKPFVNSLPVPVDYSATLHVANETSEVVKGIVNWRLCRPDSSVIKEGHQEVEVQPYAGIWLDPMDFNGIADERDMHLFYEFALESDEAGSGEKTCDQAGKDNRCVVSSGSTLFVAPKHYHFADPKLTVQVADGKVVVHADAYARGVCIESEDGNLRLSDNFFDMEKGERILEIVGEAPAGELRVRSVYDIA